MTPLSHILIIILHDLYFALDVNKYKLSVTDGDKSLPYCRDVC